MKKDCAAKPGEALNMDCERIELGFVVNLRTLRDVLRSLSAGGTHWWFASDPADAMERGYISLGYGYPECIHPLNTASFRFPILNKTPPREVDDVVVAIGSSVCIAAQSGFYIEDGELVPNDALETFQCFYSPIHRALLERLRARC